MKLSCETNKCFCPMGSYKDAESGFACKVCPSGTTTTLINSLSCIGEVAKPVHMQRTSHACTAVAGIAGYMWLCIVLLLLLSSLFANVEGSINT
jgi:hypothetical protein